MKQDKNFDQFNVQQTTGMQIKNEHVTNTMNDKSSKILEQNSTYGWNNLQLHYQLNKWYSIQNDTRITFDNSNHIHILQHLYSTPWKHKYQSVHQFLKV